MKILIIMDPGILIPVTGYGGHERLVEMFAKEYICLGHEVHLLITDGSYVEGCVMHELGKAGFPPKKKDAKKAVFTAWKFLWKHNNSFDLIHNFGRLIYLLPVWNAKIKKIMTYGREITGANINKLLKLPNKNIAFTGCSKNLISRSGAKGNWHAVYNAIEFDKYTLQQNIADDAPLMFLGRIEKIKGCHTAIEVAKATNNKLVIAGNISPLAEEQKYFKEEIEPHIDGEQIRYIGTVNDAQKNEWLGKSKALLFPIEWNEPFGIVMIEAMACGTPVIAFKKGSIEEVIDEGVTGFKVNSKEDMIIAVKKVNLIDRKICGMSAKSRFDVKNIAQEYLSINFISKTK
jgi:glycosyltransferase involved in cell wall biosynthesis